MRDLVVPVAAQRYKRSRPLRRRGSPGTAHAQESTTLQSARVKLHLPRGTPLQAKFSFRGPNCGGFHPLGQRCRLSYSQGADMLQDLFRSFDPGFIAGFANYLAQSGSFFVPANPSKSPKAVFQPTTRRQVDPTHSFVVRVHKLLDGLGKKTLTNIQEDVIKKPRSIGILACGGHFCSTSFSE